MKVQTEESTCAELRSQSRKRFENLGWPTHKDEEWKYSPLPAVQGFCRAEPGSAKNLRSMTEHKLVFVNGFFDPQLSTALPAGVELDAGSLGELTQTEDQSFEVAAHLGVLIKPGVNALAALNTAEFVESASLKITGHVAEPIQIQFISTQAESVTHPRVLIQVEAGASATIIESYHSESDQRTHTNAVTEVIVNTNAVLEHIRVQNESLATVHTSLCEVKTSRDSTYRSFLLCFGGQFTRNETNIFVGGSNAHCRVDGIVCIGQDQHVDNHTRLDHAHPHCDSFEVFKHLLDANSVAVFNGKIFVYQDAQKTDAKQTNKTLLLSPKATINTKPQLEIFADDVKCTHGATVGQLREDAMFYLQSRGIPPEKAKALLVYAFAAEVLETIECTTARDQLEKMLFDKLESMRSA